MATKKITELPFINTLSGSSVFDNPNQNVVVPVVLKGTTNQITVENFSKFTNLYAAQTGSQNIFTQNQWFNTTVSASTINVGTLGVGGNTTIAGTLGVTGNGTIGGNLAVAGRITAEEFYTEITTASVIYASGSTKFGDDTGDKHEFTGSINVSGSVIYNGVILSNIDANTIQRLQQATASIQQATASLNTFTASQDGRNFILSQVTGSFAGEIGGLEAYTASLKTAAIVSSSTQILNYNIFATTASNTFVGNQNITGSLSISAGEFNVTTGSGNMTSSLIFDHTQNDGVTLGLRHNDRLSLADHTFNVKVWAGGVYTTFVRNGTPYSVLNVEAFDDNKIYLYRDTRLYNKSLVIDNNLTVQNGVVIGSGSLLVNGVITGSILATNGVISSSNQLLELNQFTASQDSRNLTLSTVTGSLIGITNGLMAFTAALDNTYATDAQLYQLYQATRSLELHSGSMIGVTNGLMAYTASNTSLNTGLRGEVDGIEAYTASLKGQAIVSSSTQVQNYDVFALNSNLYTSTGSLIGITNGLMAFTAALDSTYATDAQLYQLYQATQSLELLSGSLIGITNGLMAFTAALDSTYATDAQLYQLYAETASMKAEIAGIEAYTASLKAASIVSSSTQVQNYDVFALNSNLYNSTGSIKGEIAGIEAYTASLKGAIEVSGQNVNVLGMITAQQFNVTYVSSSTMYQSGSTKFGDTNDDKHEFTGSINLTGTQTFASTAGSGLRVYGAAGTHQWDVYLNGENLRISDNTAGDGALVVDKRASFTGPITASSALFNGNVNINGGNSVRLYETSNTNYWDAYTYTDNTLRVNYKGAGNDEIILYNDGGINFTGAVTSSKVSINSNVGNYKLNVNSGINTSQATVMALQQATNGAIKDAVGFGVSINNGGESTNAADLLISTATGGSLTTKVNVGSSGDVTISNGNLVMGTSGKGIDFSANTGGAGKSSQLLDDYEEGTLTGTITCGTSGTVTLDNGYNTLSYTKIGSVVHVFGLLSVSSVSSPVGYFTIPLPFACANLGDSAATSAATIIVNGTNAANTSDFVGWADETQSNIVVRRGDATGVQNTSANELKALTDIYIQFTYRAN